MTSLPGGMHLEALFELLDGPNLKFFGIHQISEGSYRALQTNSEVYPWKINGWETSLSF